MIRGMNRIISRAVKLLSFVGKRDLILSGVPFGGLTSLSIFPHNLSEGSLKSNNGSGVSRVSRVSRVPGF